MSHGSEYPGFFARFYDVIYKHVRSDEDSEYFLTKIRECKGPVLEVGVGTGRFFIEALDKGADIYGIDISPSMINILQSKLSKSEHHRIEVQDLCKLELHRSFDLIVAPFRVFMHLTTIQQQFEALDAVFRHLKPGGTFIFDLFVPNFKMLADGLNNVKDFDGEYAPGKKLVRFTSMHTDISKQINYVAFKFIWKEGDTEHSKTWNTEMRYFFRYEIEHLINQSELILEAIHGDFKENELTKDSKEFIVVCKKP
ncbi:MAG: class I SAM-dependent methyltransferase [Bacteroidales bacterium]